MKFNFSLESDNLEQDISKIVDVLVNAYEKCSKIDESVVTNVRKDLHGLDNRVDGIESRLNFCEVDLTEIKETSKKKEK